MIALKLACPSTPANNTMVRASAPQSAGRSVCKDLRFIGILPAPQAGACDITALYTARFGVPPVGTKVFVAVNQVTDGLEDIPRRVSDIVPAAA